MTNQHTNIIGVSGTNGSGKDSLMHYLATQYHFLLMSATDMLATELTRRGLPTDRPHKSKLSAEWRRQYGMAVIAERAYEAYQTHIRQYQGLVVGSLRHGGEADAIHQWHGMMVWVDADPHIRYQRIQAAKRNRPGEDDLTFEAFMADEEREMHPEGDQATLDMFAVKQKSDVILQNDHDLEAFYQQIKQALSLG